MDMHDESVLTRPADTTVAFHLLAERDFQACRELERELAEQASLEGKATILLCEHPPLITVGRQGSWGDIRLTADQLRRRRLRVQWVSRGGGTILHGPGQLAIYPVVPLDWFGWSEQELERRLLEGIAAALRQIGFPCRSDPGRHGIWGRSGQLVASGVDSLERSSRFGAYINVHPRLTESRFLETTRQPPPGTGDGTMSCLLAEQQRPVKMPTVRSLVIEHFARQLGSDDYHLYTGHPRLLADAD